MRKFIVTMDQGSFRVHLEDKPEFTGIAVTVSKALINLIVSFGQHVGLEMEWNQGDALTANYLERRGEGF